MFFVASFWYGSDAERTPIARFNFVDKERLESVVLFMQDNFPGCKHSILPCYAINYEIWTDRAIEIKHLVL